MTSKDQFDKLNERTKEIERMRYFLYLVKQLDPIFTSSCWNSKKIKDIRKFFSEEHGRIMSGNAGGNG